LACRVFWISYAAQHRAVPTEGRKRLLRYISECHKDNWFERPEYEREFETQYDGVVQFFYTKLQNIAQRFLGSPAGSKFQEETNKKRHNNAAVPGLNIQQLCRYDTADGISWGIQDVFDLFGILTEISETTPLDPNICPGVSPEWFVSDVGRVNAKSPDSWLNKLTCVANTLAILWILIIAGYSLAGNQHIEVSRSSFEALLERVPTPSFNSQVSHFPIEDNSLAEWLDILGYGPEPTPLSEHQTIVEQNRKIARQISDGRAFVPAKALEEAVVKGNFCSNRLRDEVDGTLAQLGIRHATVRGMEACSIPSTPVYAPALSRLDYAWIHANSLSKFQIALQMAKADCELWAGLAAKCQMQAQEWDEQITRLEKQLHVLHEAKEEALRLLEQLGQRSERLFAMKQEAEEANIYPLYPQGLQDPGDHSSTRLTWSPESAKDRPSTWSLSPPPSRTPPPPSNRDPVYVSLTLFC